MPSSKARRARRANAPRAQEGSSSRGSNALSRMTRRNASDISERWAPLFPVRTTRKLRYAGFISLGGASGVMATHVLAANGLFDPDITGTGHQPMGFDQMMLSYNHYAVLSAKITVTFTNHSATACTPTCAVLVDGGSTPQTVINDVQEFGLLTQTMLSAVGTDGAIKVIENAVSIKKYEGVKDVVDVVELRGSVSANPAELTYFHLKVWDNYGLTPIVQCNYLIEFTAVFTEPRQLSASLTTSLKQLVLEEAKRPGSEDPHPVRGTGLLCEDKKTEEVETEAVYDYYGLQSGKWVGRGIDGYMQGSGFRRVLLGQFARVGQQFGPHVAPVWSETVLKGTEET